MNGLGSLSSEGYFMKKTILLLALVILGSAAAGNDGALRSLFSERGLDGCIVIYDAARERWIYSDESKAKIGTIPASTFKILNSLIALREGAIDENEYLRWDGVDKRFKGQSVKSWNSDMNLEWAFRNSAVWFYVELSKRIPRSVYGRYLQACGYGNLDLSEGGDDFWNYGPMKVTPQNQVEFLVRLRARDLPFAEKDIDLIKALMVMASNDSYTLSGKSGWGIQGGADIGWLVGYLEKGHEVYFFATRIIADSKDVPKDFSQARTAITLEAFRKLRIIE